MLRRVLLASAAALVVVAVVLAVSGGFRTIVGGFRISARSPVAASFAALIAGAAWFVLARRERAFAADLEGAWLVLERHASGFIGVVALVAAIVASTFATRSAAGADASGYLSQAAMWAGGNEFYFESFEPPFQFPDRNPWLLVPLGWLPPEDGFAGALQAPTYPPGLPLLMAIPHALGGLDGAVLVVIIATALAVWATGMSAGGIAGIVASSLIAFSPVFIYQSIQPMSDVPVTAAWMVCFLLLTRPRLSAAAGVACAIAVLIRPNLAPLAIVPFVVAPRKLAFASPVVVAGLFLAYVQTRWYGSPWQSGYGSAGELFSLSNTGPNAGRYLTWLIATAPVLLMAPLGVARLKHDRMSRALGVFAVLVIGAYLIYAVFEHWSYLRFLLPAIAVFAIFAGIELAAWIERWPAAWRAPMCFALVLGVTAHGLGVARSLETFRLGDQFRRVEQVARYIDRSAPHDAVIVAGEQSGSMRYQTQRTILRWEAAAPEELAAATTALTAADRPVLIVLDAWEHDLFLAKFKDVPAVALDWPAAIDAGTSHRTKVWRLSDHARFLKGENLSTTRLP